MAVPDLGPGRRLTPRPVAVALAALTALATASACGPPRDGLDEETYVEVMAHLTVAGIRHVDEDRADSARAHVLDRFGVPPEELVAFAERHGDDVAYMTEIWQAIQARVDSLDRGPGADETEGGLRPDPAVEGSEP